MKKKLAFLLAILSIPTLHMTQATESEIIARAAMSPGISVMSSDIILKTDWDLGTNKCDIKYNLIFATSGTVSVTLEKKVGLNWVKVKSCLPRSFSNTDIVRVTMPVSNLEKGDYLLTTVINGETVYDLGSF